MWRSCVLRRANHVMARSAARLRKPEACATVASDRGSRKLHMPPDCAGAKRSAQPVPTCSAEKSALLTVGGGLDVVELGVLAAFRE